jgi:hypothetical protein
VEETGAPKENQTFRKSLYVSSIQDKATEMTKVKTAILKLQLASVNALTMY